MPGPVILDLLGLELTSEERELLHHPLVGGVILFARNYQSVEQVTALCQSIRKARKQPTLITVDQEGGRIQRFRSEFIHLPPMELIGQYYDDAPEEGLQLAETCGWLMATEVLSVGVDLSFAPVLDLNKNICSVIGDRSFHRDPHSAAKLAIAFTHGMQQAGMAAVGKHFPGHGSVEADSHLELPVDDRDMQTIAKDDLIPFVELIKSGIQAIMPAHILVPAIDDKPIGFSPYWLRDVLRKQLNFKGVIVSDALDMKGAESMGSYDERARLALDAGCDIVLICNNREGAIEILDNVSQTAYTLSTEKFNSLQGRFFHTMPALHASAEWKTKHTYLQKHLEHTLT